jgi:MEMO1 family protein
MDVGVVLGCLTPHPPIFVPAVAGRRVEQVRQSVEAMRDLAAGIRDLAPDTLLLVSPHAPVDPLAMSVSVAARYGGDFSDFGAPSVELSAESDPILVDALRAECIASGVPLTTMGQSGTEQLLDHGAAVPLYFLREAGVESALTLTSFSSLDVNAHLQFGRAIAASARTARRRVVLVASGDMSHRLIPGAPAGYSPAGMEFDRRLVEMLKRSDYPGILSMEEELLHQAGECGYRSLVIALGALPDSKAELLSYEGPFGVGYAVARFSPGGESRDDARRSSMATVSVVGDTEEQEILSLARSAVEGYVRQGRVEEPPLRPLGILGGRAGAFVCLKIGGELRGCIGTFLPSEDTLAAEIVRSAVAAATRDPRFEPVEMDELPLLHYSVDILSSPEPVESWEQLDPKRYGVIVQSAGRRGLLLPDLEGVDSVEVQVDIARRKAGIPMGATLELSRFTVRRVSE